MYLVAGTAALAEHLLGEVGKHQTVNARGESAGEGETTSHRFTGHHPVVMVVVYRILSNYSTQL